MIHILYDIMLQFNHFKHVQNGLQDNAMHHFAQLSLYTCKKKYHEQHIIIAIKYNPHIIWYDAAIQSIHICTKTAYKTMPCIILRSCHHTHAKRKIASSLSLNILKYDPHTLWYYAAIQSLQTYTKRLTRQCHASFRAAVIIHMKKDIHQPRHSKPPSSLNP
jgi:hypothetical protein